MSQQNTRLNIKKSYYDGKTQTEHTKHLMVAKHKTKHTKTSMTAKTQTETCKKTNSEHTHPNIDTLL